MEADSREYCHASLFDILLCVFQWVAINIQSKHMTSLIANDLKSGVIIQL